MRLYIVNLKKSEPLPLRAHVELVHNVDRYKLWEQGIGTKKKEEKKKRRFLRSKDNGERRLVEARRRVLAPVLL